MIEHVCTDRFVLTENIEIYIYVYVCSIQVTSCLIKNNNKYDNIPY